MVTWEEQGKASYLCLSSLVTAEHAAVLAERARPNDTSYISIALASLKGCTESKDVWQASSGFYLSDLQTSQARLLQQLCTGRLS